jgi:hypothetical protein
MSLSTYGGDYCIATPMFHRIAAARPIVAGHNKQAMNSRVLIRCAGQGDRYKVTRLKCVRNLIMDLPSATPNREPATLITRHLVKSSQQEPLH